MFRKIFALSALGLSLFRCGVGNPGTEVSKDLRKIKAPVYTNFHLNLNERLVPQSTMSFGGSLLLWKNLSENQGALTDFIGFSNEIKELLAAKEKLSLEKKRLLTDMSQIETDLVKKASGQVRTFLESHEADSFSEKVNALVSVETRKNKNFSQACDAQYLDFVTSNFVVSETYTRRPSPNPLCEAYYEERGYFNQESCSASETPKSFLSCFWSPSFLTQSQMTVALDGVEVSDEELLSGGFSKKWKAQDWKSDLITRKRILMAGYIMFTDGSRYTMKLDGGLSKPSAKLEMNLSEAIQGVLAKDFSHSSGESLSLMDLIVNVPFLGEESKADLYSMEASQEKQLASTTKALSKLFERPYTAFDREADPLSKDLAEKKRLFQEMEKPDSEYKKRVQKIDKKFGNRKGKFDKIVAENDFLHALWPSMGLNLTQNQDGTLDLSWALDAEAGTKTYHCKVRRKASEDAAAETLSRCSYDKNTGRLQFTVRGSLMEDSGWELYQKEVLGAKFNHIEKELFRDAELLFDVSYVLYEGVIPMFTGDITINEDGEEIYKGSLFFKSA